MAERGGAIHDCKRGTMPCHARVHEMTARRPLAGLPAVALHYSAVESLRRIVILGFEADPDVDRRVVVGCGWRSCKIPRSDPLVRSKG
jgi:hypothetical protein